MKLYEIKKTLDPKWVGVEPNITMESPFGFVLIQHNNYKGVNNFTLYVDGTFIDSTYCLDSIKDKYYEFVYDKINEYKKYLGL